MLVASQRAEFLLRLDECLKERWLLLNVACVLMTTFYCSRFLETEYIRHCVPNKASSGLSSLPLPHVYVDGVVKSDQPTTQKLPSGHKLNGTQTYLKLISIFTNLDFSPKQLRDIAQQRLDDLLSQVK